MAFRRFALITVIISSISSEPIIQGIDIGQVMKGKVVNGNEFPYLVYMEISYKQTEVDEYEFNCGGVLIKPKVVLTAAHCVSVCGKITSILVWGGVSNLKLHSNLGQKNYAKYYRVHKNYGGEGDPMSPTYMHNDMALIWLNKGFKNKDGVNLAKLPNHPVMVTGNKGWSAGWGKTESQEMSSVLKKVQMEIVSKNSCEEYYAPSEKNFCAQSVRRGSGVGFGDSGGPLVLKDVVAGIISHGCIYFDKFSNGTEVSQCDISKPFIFMDTYKYKNWIDWNINDVAKKLFVVSAKKIPSYIAELCKKKRTKNKKGGKLNPYREWRNTTIKVVPPILI